MAQTGSRFYPTYFLCLFLGVFGVHRFYNGQVKSGIVQLLTFGGCGFWWLIDMVIILTGKFKDQNGVDIPNLNPKLSWPIFVVLVILGIASGSADTGSSPGSSGSSSGVSSPSRSALERRLVGVYECANPMWVIQLKSDGSFLQEALDTGDRFRGTWSASGGEGVMYTDTGVPLTFSIQSDGAIVIDKYGYTFVRTR